jgi:NAD(P)-dependent dehydrogenase (short-subunit alcohol dehydrogenase family)
MTLEDKVVIITGSASGMGKATALECAAQGASVVVADLNEAGAQAVADQITRSGGTAMAHRADLTEEADVAALVDATVARFGSVHGLHNNAYAVHPSAGADLVNTTLEAWEWTIKVCLTSQFLCSRAVIPHMIAAGGGSIVNVSSGNGFGGGPGAAAYGAAKAGAAVVSKYIATQYGKRGIRCNTIVPGFTAGTGWQRPDEEPTEALRELFDRALDDICMPRLPVPADIAAVVAFLLSDAGASVQGATIDVNGGFLAHMPGLRFQPTPAPKD